VGEQALCGVLFLAMAVVVFADVLHRVFTRAPGRLSVIVGPLVGQSAVEFDRAANPVLVGTLVLVLAYAALRTRAASDARPASRARSALTAVVMTALAAGVVQGYIYLKPEGIVWSPYLALSMMLWLGLVGSSMATYAARHITVEMSEKLWPRAWQPGLRRVASFATAVFCAMIAVLGAMSVAAHYRTWEGNPQAGLVPAVDLPRWAVYLVIPYAFGMMAARLGGRAAGLLANPGAPQEME
jgi:TRAP-type C4-dicarboxylate transport system permease small subunit